MTDAAIRLPEAAPTGGSEEPAPEAEASFPEPLVRLDRVTIRDGRKTLLAHVSLSLHPGEVTTIVGPNGGGKTTLLRAVIGDLSPAEGRVERRDDLRIGYVPQILALDRTLPLTAERFVRLADNVSVDEARVALERVGAAHLARTQLIDLSGGERQRALLARALARRPNLLILDEPTQGLDQTGSAVFYRLIDDIRREQNVGVAMVSHELHVVMAASDQVICVNGHVCCQGAPEAVSAHPEYRKLFAHSAEGALALYRHQHDHAH